MKAIEYLVGENAYALVFGFLDFQLAISVAPNDVLCHGIPDDRPIQGAADQTGTT